jgi:NADPH-dependent 2,4-dienoyl-CoA reductase/sulfur reductase-like enzyme
LDVCIVEREETILPLVAHPECARMLARQLRRYGHVLRLGTTLESVDATASGLLIRVRSAAGGGSDTGSVREEVDLIVVCTGSRANLDFLQTSGVAAATGLIVDEHMRTSAPDLYAAGDVAQAFDPVSGASEVVALWSNARLQGRVAGLNMAGVHAECPGSIPCNIQHIGDVLFASGGSMRTFDECDVRSSDCGLTALAFKDGRLVGFNLLGDVRPAGPLTQALAREARASAPGDDTAKAWMRRITWTSLNAS